MTTMLPPGRKREALSADLSTQWAQTAHLLFLDALMKAGGWNQGDLAFHGGTSLHLSWQSTRYSEDLDFLLTRADRDMAKAVGTAVKLMHEQFRRIDPGFEVTLRDKTKDADRMLVYHLVVSHPRVVGNTMVKAEFWKTDREYLMSYPTELRAPRAPGDFLGVVSYPVPAASLQTAFADKLVAFATRPHLKWRDIYDLWWLGTQSTLKVDRDAVAKQFLHNVSAYTTLGGRPAHVALLGLLDRDRKEVIAQADPDLKTWLPADLWKALHPAGVEQMVDYARATLQAMHDHIAQADNTSKPIKRRRP
ncbi:nucleotidyl transferase AbiEii/AbiGii toxin family protein [Hydrogenophaga sp. 2FB]|uniref:nucleotidyl transferase AbiEii/AbiGii toxin family protein n=1 Tax=Hydrogenophaga sp. 2FB TaxID=2502187 RepID=UPI0010F93926|nr:nucleotidyl transferase AbiEii/AbiGii toxin family protein [Hydrogenophaga sp. 2FB]